ncbi:MAG: peptidoglycan DD-metalloendopeptidase family protein [Boseongicola sp.]|nr:peptidoglycan DD-metalloendopeptidase family protein [Silicimonas sp.]NND40847.1 peptidoglycan DD-metalloendopeptidase family protein [Silicimonas sp.]NNF91069.1 peptidoglycan DD-metalloendopeptidase family protein [Boseongicola sp.]
MRSKAFSIQSTALAVSLLALAGCGGVGGFDVDLRGGAGGFDTSDAARNAIADRPQPDTRGVVSYPGYQVAIARRGDTIDSVATRIGTDPVTLARYNAIPQNTPLRDGEIIALPERVAEPGTGTLAGGNVDVATIAGAAIDRADGGPGLPPGDQPTRHRVSSGETAFSIARLYGVPVAALAEWNGLGPDLALREGQYLLIPTPAPEAEVAVATLDPVEGPGTGSATPLPPSAAQPLPREETRAAAPAAKPLDDRQTASSDTARLRMPVQGRIIRPYSKGKNEGIGISADAGSTVVAADDGTVAAITRDTDQVPIVVVRHDGNLLTVYAGVDQVGVKKGDKVKRGQKIAVVRSATPPFLHFEVREGFESVDPGPYLN